jgi:hypothetical protein
MSAPINDGGPAFPAQLVYRYPNGTSTSYNQEGMTLRDYFAGQVLVGALADPTCQPSPIELAKIAYRGADAMLAAREVKQ